MSQTSNMNNTKLVLGTAQLAQAYGITRPLLQDEGRGPKLLAAAAHLGIMTLDTAPTYGDAEATIGVNGWLGEVHTKLSRDLDPAASLEASLAALRRPQVEVLYLHAPEELLDPQSSVIRSAGDLVGRGATALGASVYSVREFEVALGHPSVSVIQVPLNVLDRRFANNPLRQAAEVGVTVYARSVFLQGILLAHVAALPVEVARLGPLVKQFQQIAEAHGLTPAALALAWVRAQPNLAGVIVGAQNDSELAEIVTAWRAIVPHNALAALEDLAPAPPMLVDPRRWTT